MIEIHFPCNPCGAGLTVEGSADFVDCHNCNKRTDLSFPGEGTAVTVCGICEKKDFYRRRDFNQKIGCFVVAVGMGLALVGYYFSPWYGLFALVGLALFDLLLFKSLPEITLCYNCAAIYRGVPLNPDHKAFDLHIAEKYL